MKIKLILPALMEAKSPFWRPIKYSLFPPLGLATLAGFLDDNDSVELCDEHVENLKLDDAPDLVVIQVYITSAYRAYGIADHYRRRGVYVILGGLHVTSLPEESAKHADTIFIGPGEETFPQFLKDFKAKIPAPRYFSSVRTLANLPPIRRDLIKRSQYLVPNSIVVTRGCPHHCNFCYKDNFFSGGKSFYTQRVDQALKEIDRLPGRHLYFLDDHLFGDKKFAAELFEGMRGMNRIFQGAATVKSLLDSSVLEKAVEAGLRSLFVGFESINPDNMTKYNKSHNLNVDYSRAISRLHENGVMINGSFVFGLDGDNKDVFRRTVSWAVRQGITTATFHICTPYPGTQLHRDMDHEGRITSKNWDLYDTRQVVYKPKGMTAEELKEGYDESYHEFYSWKNLLKASWTHDSAKHFLKHLAYASGWKKFEPFWNFMIKMKQLNRTLPLLETVLTKVDRQGPSTQVKPLQLKLKALT